MWTAEIVKKEIINGLLSVDVRFSDGKNSLTETYKSRSPDSDWVEKNVADRIDQLTRVYESTISTGAVVPKVKVDPVVDETANSFINAITFLSQVEPLINLNVIRSDDKKVVDAIKIVQDNWAGYAGIL